MFLKLFAGTKFRKNGQKLRNLISLRKLRKNAKFNEHFEEWTLIGPFLKVDMILAVCKKFPVSSMLVRFR